MTTDDRDAALLESLEHKQQLIRDRVQGVAEGYQTGFYLWGEGGTSKSYTVEQTLQQLGTPYKLTNSRLTGKGLFKLLRDFPDAVHVIEDAEAMFADKTTSGVLRSALWGQVGRDGKQERLVCWQTGPLRDEFVFTGGIILVANCGLDDLPQLRAIKTRVPCLQYLPTNEEVAALMRVIARKGHDHGPYALSPDECSEVAEEIIARSSRLRRNLDLRLLVNTFKDRIQFENGSSVTHWLDLLESRMKERVVAPLGGFGVRAQRNAQEVEVAGRIAHLPAPERLVAWQAETGKSRAELYRALALVGTAASQLSQVSQLSAGETEAGTSVSA
ncbi:hypothetical protein [Urbifossiella limnaea]|uniref:Uncharacterized protein n=1 Tax=Urbifossiella limnaea TaxID=2528023 RepID=A0A517XSX8_9BACT|nr:hypothetical protein [Urbifossiella limnaea]QDU20598.1 hypothetical protein ETAA1_25530 [Urbifossiella limnaea]